MGPPLPTPPPGWGRTVQYGAEVGVALALSYALAFIGYAAVRAALALLATPDVDGGLAGTMITTGLSLALSALAFAVIVALPAAALGALSALLLRGVVSGLGAGRSPGRSLAGGGAACLALSLGLLALVFGGLQVPWTPATVGTLTFWLIAPLALYTVAGGVAGWQMARLLGPARRGQVGGRRTPAAAHG